ncbi:putative phage tail protein [Paraburkholderia sp. WSM4175]|uniref:tail assembly protein n=1 Tax=Paraburkholderia sp. WSM4175 TaxID=2991072 RepID=UPI003D224F99
MLTVVFYGALRRNFGKRYTLDVHSPKEALHALLLQIGGVREYFSEHGAQSFLVRGPHQDYDEHDIDYPQSSGVLKVVPIVEGAGAFGKILGGIFIAAIGLVFPPGALTTAVIGFGASLALSGLAELLAPRARATATPEAADNQPSLAFDGAVNTMGQGGPVPLGYGRMRVGSQVISVGFSSNNERVV